jgi:hypothetical protein
MKNLFETGSVEEIQDRIQQLQPITQAHWGKMNVAQMLAHCAKPMEMALGDIPLTQSNFFKKLLGRMIKGVITNPKPYKQGLPTDPGFVTVTNEYEFEKQKVHLLNTLNRYVKNQDVIPNSPHPFFGKLSKEECGISQYKHLDHHLSQFGV